MLTKLFEKKIAVVLDQLDFRMYDRDNRAVYTPRLCTQDKSSRWCGVYDPLHIIQLRALVRLGYLDKYVHAGTWRYFTYYTLTDKGRAIATKLQIAIMKDWAEARTDGL